MRACWLAVLVGCGRIGFDPVGDADTGVFSSIAMPSGGHARAIAMRTTPTPRQYVQYGGGRLFRRDRGATPWVECPPLPVGDPVDLVGPAVEDYDIDIASDGTLHVLAAGMLVVGDADCTAYQMLTPPQHTKMIAVGNGQLFAATVNGLWGWSSTAGWAAVSSPADGEYLRNVELDELNGRVAVSSEVGIAIRTGTTWTSQTLGRVYNVAFDATDSMRITLANDSNLYESTNGGATWNLLDPGYHGLIARDPTNPMHLISVRGDNVIETYDRGMTWSQELRTAAVGYGALFDLEFDPADGRITLGTSHGLFEGVGPAPAWQSADDPIQAWLINDVIEIAGTRYVSTTGGVWISHAGGPWQLAAPMLAASSMVRAVAGPPSMPDRVYVIGQSIARSDDRGASFQEVLGSGQTDGYAFTAIAVSDSRIWTGSATRTLYSDDAGATWIAVAVPGNPTVYALLPLGATSIVAATSRGVFWSVDRGATYTASSIGLPPGVPTMRLAELTDGRVVVGSEDGLWVTTGNNQPWTRLGFDGQHVHDVRMFGTTLVVTLRAGVFTSVDLGASFSELDGLANRFPQTLGRAGDGALLVGTRCHGFYRAALP